MRDPWLHPRTAGARYRVEVLAEARPGEAGIAHRRDGASQLLAWDRILCAVAAEVGEPEGVRTIVFDLVSEIGERGCHVYRFDAEPGRKAMEIARRLGAALGPERSGASLKSVATDGIPTRWYPDLESFEHDALQSLLDG